MIRILVKPGSDLDLLRVLRLLRVNGKCSILSDSVVFFIEISKGGGGRKLGCYMKKEKHFFVGKNLVLYFKTFWVFEKFNKNLKSVRKVCTGNDPQTSQVIARYAV